MSTDVSFEVQRDDSTPLSTVTYWRPDTHKIEIFRFDEGFSDKTVLEYKGDTLRCSGFVGGKTTKCNNLEEEKDIKAVVLSVVFNPQSGKALKNEWSRNKYSLSGSFYHVECSSKQISLLLPS